MLFLLSRRRKDTQPSSCKTCQKSPQPKSRCPFAASSDWRAARWTTFFFLELLGSPLLPPQLWTSTDTLITKMTNALTSTSKHVSKFTHKQSHRKSTFGKKEDTGIQELVDKSGLSSNQTVANQHTLVATVIDQCTWSTPTYNHARALRHVIYCTACAQ